MDKHSKRNINPFSGERYSVWKFRVRALLAELKIEDVIEENIPEMPDDEWLARDKTARNIIIEYLSDPFLGFATASSTAKEIFESLDRLYERRSLATQLALRKKLLSLKLDANTPLLKHFNSFDETVSDLIAAGGQMDEMDKVSHLLITLPTSFEGVITALETLSEDNLTLHFTKMRLLDHEVKLKNEDTTSNKVLQASTSKTKSSHYNNNNKRNWNNNFKYNQKYYKAKSQFNSKFSYNKNNYKTQRKYNLKCGHCGRRNHSKNDCFYYKKMQNKNNKYSENEEVFATAQSSTAKSFAMMAGNNKNDNHSTNKIQFILDSGATDHIINRMDVLTSSVQLCPPIEISIAKEGATISAIRKGKLHVVSNMGISGVLENVLYAPELPHNLLSVRKMQEAGMSVIFEGNGKVKVKSGGKIIITGKPLNNLTYIIFNVNSCINKTLIKVHNAEVNKHYNIWHARLGHIGKDKFMQLKINKMIEDIDQIKFVNPTNTICETCIFGKQSRLPFNKYKIKCHINKPLFIIHSDICGPINPTTLDNKNYFVTFIDGFTHYTVTYLMTFKSEIMKIFIDFVNKSEAHFNLKIVNLYCDNGREYLSNDFKDFCVQKGITYHLTVPHTPQQNGVAERMNRTICEKARTMLSGAKMDKSFWGEAVLTATYLINITPTKSISQFKTPYELWHNKKPRLMYLRVFGSTAYVHNKNRKQKFEEKSIKGILVGYEPNGYKIYDPNTSKFIIARDVIIDELNFQNFTPISHEGNENDNSHNNHNNNNNNNNDYILSNKIPRKCIELNKIPNIQTNNNNINKSVEKSDKSGILNPDKFVTKTDNIQHDESLSQEINSKRSPEPRRSERIKNLPNISYSEDDFDLINCFMTAQSVNYNIPENYHEIFYRSDSPQWQKAIKEELDSLISNRTWSLVPEPTNKNIVDCKWVFSIKNDAYGNPSRYKARLVARGFSQKYLLDYNETFAPVARMSTFRIMIAFANQFDLLIHQMDVKTAFLNGILSEDIYMKVPKGINVKQNVVCKLHKSIYGLKQSARCWYQRFDEVLKKYNFQNSSVDRCLYFLNKGHISKNIYVILYVDDLLIITYNENILQSFKEYLMKQFNMVDLKEVSLFLGIRIKRSENKISLDQTTFLKSVLDKFNMTDCNVVSTPLLPKLDYNRLNSDEHYDAPCKNLIGCLMYAMLCTRPDICTALNILSRYQTKNNKELWVCLKRVLRYIKGSLNLKLVYEKGEYNEILIGYVDSDWGSNEIDRKSTTGYVFKLFKQCTISWNSKRQNSVATSSTEAEYMALFEAVKEVLWLKSLLKSIDIIIKEPIIINEDNNSCINLANNPVYHKRSKHIDIKYHFTREQIENNTIILKYISTGQQLADVFTKPLPSPKFLEFRPLLGLE